MTNYLYGFDTANYQKGINMQQMKQNGASFVIVKSNEGYQTSYDTFNEQIQSAYQANLLLGAYSYLHKGDGKLQAQAFITSLGSWAKKIRLYADWEYFMPAQPTSSDIQTLIDFVNEVNRLTGSVCGIYTSGSYKQYIPEMGDSDYWLAGGNDYGKAIGFNYSGEYMGATIWQYTSGGGVPAYQGNGLDLNLSVIPFEKWYDSVSDKSLSKGNAQPIPSPQPKNQPNVFYALRDINEGWLSKVTNFNTVNDNGYAGTPFRKHDMLMIKVTKGSIKYRVHTVKSGWLNWVYKGDKNDLVNGCAGNPNEPIDGVQIYYTSIIGDVYQAYYRSQTTNRAGWLNVCCDDGTSISGFDGWCGVLGEPLDHLQISISNHNPF